MIRFVFFESRGLPLHVEANNRAFPVSNKAEDVVQVLSRYMQQGNVEVRTNSPVTKVVTANGSVASVFSGAEEYAAKEYIFSTGSVSHPETGSTGDGFTWLKKLGHTIVPPTPTIVPLAVSDTWVRDLAGVSLTNSRITLYVDTKKQHVLKGDNTFYSFWVIGPTYFEQCL